MKKIARIVRNAKSHWVGDGFPVRNIFSYTRFGAELSPFLLLDYAGPADFDPSNQPRGVGEHPHRGFETVTMVYAGEIEHRDSSGGGGLIGPGDVQWMTAAAGLVHEEMHGREFTKRGGTLTMVQLWVNLPAKDKIAPPAYQNITSAQIPRVALPEDAGSVRVIAGSYGDVRGPAHTFTPVNVWDVDLKAGRHAEFRVPTGHTTALVVLRGCVRLGTGETASEAELAVFERVGDAIAVEAVDDTKLVLLDGKPIDEPIAGHGPFVMNSDSEIQQAIEDFKAGRMGHLQ